MSAVERARLLAERQRKQYEKAKGVQVMINGPTVVTPSSGDKGPNSTSS
jgi:hypothetical protein